MGLFDWFSRSSADVANVGTQATLPGAGNDNQFSANDNMSAEFSLTDTANSILRATLANQTVGRYGNPSAVRFPVQKLSLKSIPYQGYVSDEEKAIPHGEQLTLEILLRHC